ncbi:hypothetical protein NHX12_020586, partial [Muraenolepis orangiensis]
TKATKTQTLRSMQGIFTDHGTTDTELAVFDISPPSDAKLYRDPDFIVKDTLDTLNNWLIVFVGTGDGQLLKLTVDRNLEARCLSAIWKADDDRRVFPKMHLDPVGRKHVLVAVRNQSCWTAGDPYCGWCDSSKRCSFEDECPASLWLSIPDDLGQRRMLSHGFQEDRDGKMELVIHTHLRTGGAGAPANFSCRFVTIEGELGGLRHQYPQCTCLLPPVMGLRVTVTVSLGEVAVTEELNLVNCSGITGTPTSLLCSRCFAAGCWWSRDACTWTGPGTKNPEVFNITPSDLSFYGKNHALLTGLNLGHVTGVRIQGVMECSPKEAPVRVNMAGDSLTFHIPAGDKGQVTVCLLLPDGRCHGNASLAYRSAPVCTAVKPDSTWASGKRKMELTGSNLEFVDQVVHSHTDQKVPFTKSGNGGTLRYESLAVELSLASFSSSVALAVANVTLACGAVRYLPDPQFTTFDSTPGANHLFLTIE